jgi:hypothetical protein
MSDIEDGFALKRGPQPQPLSSLCEAASPGEQSGSADFEARASFE